MDFRFARSNVRHIRNNVAANYFVVLTAILMLFGMFRTVSMIYFVVLAAAIGVAGGLWYRRARLMQEVGDRLVGTTISITEEGLVFRGPSAMNNILHETMKLKYSDLEAFRVVRLRGPKNVVLRLKKRGWLPLLPLEDQEVFTSELRRYVPEEKRIGWYGDRWQRV